MLILTRDYYIFFKLKGNKMETVPLKSQYRISVSCKLEGRLEPEFDAVLVLFVLLRLDMFRRVFNAGCGWLCVPFDWKNTN